ncbi:hypothetical protein Droror1_Dr00023338 [Drosera rotundifolia]
MEFCIVGIWEFICLRLCLELFLSKSGNTEELIRLGPCGKAKGVYLIAVNSVENNSFGVTVAPVMSIAIQMVFGDTVAIALMGARNLTREEYAANHPAGRIGKSFIFKEKDVMKRGEELPLCREGDLIMDQLCEQKM